MPAYRRPNDRVLAWAGESDGQLIPFVRLALGGDDPLAEAERCIDLGARGIKLHPRAQAFSVDDPRLEDVFAFAAERRLPVLIHAGRGLPPGLAEELAHVADRHPAASLILAHAAIVDQSAIASFANSMPNVFFDTSDLDAARRARACSRRSGPSRSLFASDIPYGDQLYYQYLLLRPAQGRAARRRGSRGVMGDTAHAADRGRAAPTDLAAHRSDPTIHARPSIACACTTTSQPPCRCCGSGRLDPIGFLGLAAGALPQRRRRPRHVHELIVAAEARLGRARSSPTTRQMERRRRDAQLFHVLNLAQARALYH